MAAWSGTVYVAFVTDVYSRAIVGWAAAVHKRANLVLDALQMALWRRDQDGRRPGPGLVHHSGAGSQYTSFVFTAHLAGAGIDASVGDVLDNALMESTIGLYKTELITKRGPWKTLADVELATADCVDWYNAKRLHTAIGGIPPAGHEAAYYAQNQPHPEVVELLAVEMSERLFDLEARGGGGDGFGLASAGPSWHHQFRDLQAVILHPSDDAATWPTISRSPTACPFGASSVSAACLPRWAADERAADPRAPGRVRHGPGHQPGAGVGQPRRAPRQERGQPDRGRLPRPVSRPAQGPRCRITHRPRVAHRHGPPVAVGDAGHHRQ